MLVRCREVHGPKVDNEFRMVSFGSRMRAFRRVVRRVCGGVGKNERKERRGAVGGYREGGEDKHRSRGIRHDTH